LFYDLVYVVTIVQLGNKLSENVSAEGFIAFVLLFVPVWWIWMGTTFYANRFDADDLPHRLLVFVQIFVVSLLAISVYDGLGASSQAFALSYAAARGVLVVMYLRAAQHAPLARTLARRYATGFAVAALIWLVSAFVPPPLRFALWVVGLAVDFYTPLSPRSRQLQRELPPSPHHLPERLGLFTIIVFGESFLKVIGGFAGAEHYELGALLVALVGLILVGTLWWLYFENVAERGVNWARGAQIWLYTHLPLQIGLTALAVGVYKLANTHAGEPLADKYRLLITGAVALTLVSLAVIESFTVKNEGERSGRPEFWLRLIGALILLGVGFFGSGMTEGLVIAIAAIVCLAQLAYDLTRRSGRAIAEHEGEIEV
jgi:low temperature requirement protein LtrA